MVREPATNFYPRSPCGERLETLVILPKQFDDFYPRSPCGERQAANGLADAPPEFLSTLSLRRATFRHCTTYLNCSRISIHALLAESDDFRRAIKCAICNFYPRSPCGERRFQTRHQVRHMQFLSTLSLRRATISDAPSSAPYAISIHALLAESDQPKKKSTRQTKHFYPRSPCGERHRDHQKHLISQAISIHALLAESDKWTPLNSPVLCYFYPRSPCGERQRACSQAL